MLKRLIEWVWTVRIRWMLWRMGRRYGFKVLEHQISFTKAKPGDPVGPMVTVRHYGAVDPLTMLEAKSLWPDPKD